MTSTSPPSREFEQREKVSQLPLARWLQCSVKSSKRGESRFLLHPGADLRDRGLNRREVQVEMIEIGLGFRAW